MTPIGQIEKKPEGDQGSPDRIKAEPVPYRTASDALVEQILDLVKNQDEY